MMRRREALEVGIGNAECGRKEGGEAIKEEGKKVRRLESGMKAYGRWRQIS